MRRADRIAKAERAVVRAAEWYVLAGDGAAYMKLAQAVDRLKAAKGAAK